VISGSPVAMTQISPTFSLAQPRLLTLLADMATGAASAPPQHLGQQLGRMIDLPNSVSLSATLAGLSRLVFEPLEEDPVRARDDFLRVHAAMIGAVLRSLSPERGPSRIRWPEPVGEEAVPVEAYGKFYAANQREMEARVRGLQERVRDVLTGARPELAQLVSLESALGNAFQARARRLYAAIPAIVSRHLEQLRDAGVDAPEARLRDEVQTLLLAEVEARLLPVQGLIEALDDYSHGEST
jgi:hypothetical protein